MTQICFQTIYFSINMIQISDCLDFEEIECARDNTANDNITTPLLNPVSDAQQWSVFNFNIKHDFGWNSSMLFYKAGSETFFG